MVKKLHFASWEDMERQARDIIDFLAQTKIAGIIGKKKDFEHGSLDNKYRIWIELKIVEYLFHGKHSVEILKDKNPDIKVDTDKYIEIKSFDKENFKEQEIIVNLADYLDKNFSQWRKLNFQIFIKYSVGSQSKVNEQRDIMVKLLDDNSIQNQLYQDVVNCLKQKLEHDTQSEFYSYKFDIVYFNSSIKDSRKVFMDNSYSGDDENWLLNRIKNLAEGAKEKFSVGDFNILFIYYPFIKRDFIDETNWQILQSDIWKDIDIRKIYKAIAVSDFDKLFRATQNIHDENIVKTLFK
ncbi:hypothetical protein KKF60_03090 [Patescibacteria group bacterium]|nr:hypothetical protein [Patescibacteria group bacterium]MBU4458855.1 hypothetical protein [Patescibacteria group bacterium]MCG2696140.1 hypothetical protein [Candidatus Portnoybacteria bacterium]